MYDLRLLARDVKGGEPVERCELQRKWSANNRDMEPANGRPYVLAQGVRNNREVELTGSSSDQLGAGAFSPAGRIDVVENKEDARALYLLQAVAPRRTSRRAPTWPSREGMSLRTIRHSPVSAAIAARAIPGAARSPIVRPYAARRQ